MQDREKLLGFDVRKMRLKNNVVWNDKRKETYLLRPDVDKVLSTDTIVWPSLLKVNKSTRSSSQNIDLNLWDNLKTLQNHLTKIRETAQEPYCIIGITLLLHYLNKKESEMWNPILVQTPLDIIDDKDWVFLGYDISDMAFLSGLSNCGYKPEEIQSLRKRWGQHINSFNLFTDPSQAFEFKKFSDKRVVEHAPFFVYGLYAYRPQ